MKFKNYVGIDPGGFGGETGIVWVSVEEDTPATLHAYWAVPDLVDGFTEWFNTHGRKIDWGETHVLVENFEDFGIRGADWSPLKVIGATEALIKPSAGDFTLVRPIDRKWVTNDAMRSLDMYVKGGHHRDVTEAARHVVSYLSVNERHKPTMMKGGLAHNGNRF